MKTLPDQRLARPVVDVQETPEAYVVTAELPLLGQVAATGVRASLEAGVLTVTVPKASGARTETAASSPYPPAADRGPATLAEPALSEAVEVPHARRAALIESLQPPTTVPSVAAVLQARRNAEAREGLLHEHGALTSAEVAELAGSEAKNRAALAHRWKQEGRIFSVTRHGVTLFPGFQFDDEGRPKAVVAEVVRRLGGDSSEWELALWFTKPTGWLGGRRPVDVLDRQPEAVVEAADREAAGLVY